MFGHGTFPRSSSEFLMSDSPVDVMSPLNFPLCPLTQLTIPESLDSVSMSDALHSTGSSSGSRHNSPSCTSLASCCNCTQKQSLMQRSSSSQYFTSNLIEFIIDSDSGPVRRVFSTGDLDHGLQNRRRRSESPNPILSNEKNTNAIIEGMMTGASPYSPEEKKERIERYRSKRNLRNFNKKIKYACRKTLADSRPRIRGRFVRNEEIEKNCPQVDQWSHTVGGEEEDEDEDNWANFLDSLSANLINP